MTDFSELWPGGPRFAQAETMRLSTDSVLLADFARLRGGEKGIDLGCASGAIALLLLTREPRLHMTGLELDAEAAELARENMRVNALTERSRILTGDIREVRGLFPAGSFDFVIANPPYYPPGSGRLSPDPARARARGETECRRALLPRPQAGAPERAAVYHDGPGPGAETAAHRVPAAGARPEPDPGRGPPGRKARPVPGGAADPDRGRRRGERGIPPHLSSSMKKS